jgi:hypothetical protein
MKRILDSNDASGLGMFSKNGRALSRKFLIFKQGAELSKLNVATVGKPSKSTKSNQILVSSLNGFTKKSFSRHPSP